MVTPEGVDAGARPRGGGSDNRRGGLPTDAGTWAAVGFVAVGTLLVAAALVPAVLSGPANPYAAAMLIVLALGAIAAGCAIEAYGLARRYVSRVPAILAALVACVPAIAPIFQPGGGDLTVVLVWMVLLAFATLLVRRSRAAWILAAVTALPVLGLFALSVAKSG